VIFAILARKLELEAFGFVGLTAVLLEYVRVFVDQGFSEAVVQRANVDREHLDTAFWTGVVSGAVLAVGLALAAEPLAAVMGEPALTPIIRWLSLGLFISGLATTQQALLQRRLAFRQLAARSFVAQLGAGAIGISMAFAGYGVWALVAQSIGEAVFGVITL
jgi:PST family polysaccharide transporter